MKDNAHNSVPRGLESIVLRIQVFDFIRINENLRVKLIH